VDAEVRKELEATVAARRELGGEHDDALIEGFLQRVEHRLDERSRHAPAPRPHGLELRLALGSMALGVGVTAVANSDAHGVGGVIISIIAWIAIALINIAYARLG
jgi:ferric-dicitrate binding protein FerR (iron transport regulator)